MTFLFHSYLLTFIVNFFQGKTLLYCLFTWVIIDYLYVKRRFNRVPTPWAMPFPSVGIEVHVPGQRIAWFCCTLVSLYIQASLICSHILWYFYDTFMILLLGFQRSVIVYKCMYVNYIGCYFWQKMRLWYFFMKKSVSAQLRVQWSKCLMIMMVSTQIRA